MRLVAAALALAVVLALAGVLGERLCGDKHHAGECGGAGAASEWPEMGWALRRAVVPPRRPTKAAASARLLTVVVFMKSSFLR